MPKIFKGMVVHVEESEAEELQRHEALKQMCIDSYDSADMNKNYNVIKESVASESGFKGYAVQTAEDEITIVYRGTDINFSSSDRHFVSNSRKNFGAAIRDLKNDLDMAKSNVPAQMTEALDFIFTIKNQYPNAKIRLTGHSLGGSLATMIAIIVNVDEAVTFSPYGVRNIMDEYINKHGVATPPELITNYSNPKDPIARVNLKNNYGQCYFVPRVASTVWMHPVENWQPLETRIPINHTKYLGVKQGLYNHTILPVKNAVQKVQDYVGDVYDKAKSIPKNIKQKIHRVKLSNECAGTYSVSGYTRSDGTKVEGYTRTCGAKHSGAEKYAGKRFQDIPPEELEEAIRYFI
ncbi:MAG: DUF2974 domain-containing protein [Candidatus Gastranaerophilales bacterium]|nr:DUF2974 domain-containing protein [Candidatus Gastranaerophilales bacterium]